MKDKKEGILLYNFNHAIGGKSKTKNLLYNVKIMCDIS